MSGENRPRRPAAAFGSARDEAIGIGPLRLSRRRLQRARGRAQADFDVAETLVRQSLARVRQRSGGEAAPKLDRRPDGSLVSPPLPTPVSRVAKAGRNGAGTPLDALKARWRDAVREGKLAAKAKEAEIRAEYERGVRHDPRLHAQHHGVLPPPRPDHPEITARRS